MIDNTSDKFRHSLLANIGRRLTRNAFNDGFALYEYLRQNRLVLPNFSA